MSILKKAAITLACLAFFAVSAHASASNVYIAQNATGAANGADCADAKPVSFFNSSGNWGSGSNQIGPGTTVHLCGTFTGAAGSTMLTIQGSGASGNPITILFESGAQLNAPYWSTNGAITCSGANYITIDGGANGVIQATANGSGLTYQAGTIGIYFGSSSHVEVRNLTLSNLYVHTSISDEGGSHNSAGIYFASADDYISIHNNTISNVFEAIDVNYDALTNAQIYSNTIDYITWGIAFGDNNSSANASGISIYGNSIGGHFLTWQDTAFNNHFDGIFLYAVNGGTLSNAAIYNNYIHGDMSAAGTAYINLGGEFSGVQIFNNVLVQDVDECNITTCGPLGHITAGQSGFSDSNLSVYNNTIVGAGTDRAAEDTGCIIFGTGNWSGTQTFENNICTNIYAGLQFYASNTAALTASSNNIFYNVTYVGIVNVYKPTNYATLGNWQSATGFDPSGIGGGSGSTSANPSLNSNYLPQATPSIMSIGANLSSLGMTPLDSDRAGVPRPSSGPWFAGAYQSSGSLPAPPSGVTAVVQ